MSRSHNLTLPAFMWRVTAIHIITYFIAGLFFSLLFDYKELFGAELLSHYMKPTTTPIVGLGPALQIFRGILFALVIWPIWGYLSDRSHGWLILASLLIGIGVLGTFGPTPGSIEGLLYTKVPIIEQLMFLPEIVLQPLALAFALFYWCKYPKRWINGVALVMLAFVVFMSIAGYLHLSAL